MARDDDEAWRAIVDNYGERPDLDAPGVEGSTGESSDDGLVEARPDEIIGPARFRAREPGWDDLYPDTGEPGEPRDAREAREASWRVEREPPVEDEDRFVPPPPPPIPSTTSDRLAAWLGIFGTPVILLVCLVLGIRLPELVTYLLVVGFVGGFVYLVVKMSREPRDPDDNGAVL